MAETSRSAALQPLEAPRSLAEDAADRIREQILAGGFPQGEHLVEARIAEREILHRDAVRKARSAEELAKLDEEHARDRDRFARERDQKIAQIRKRPD